MPWIRIKYGCDVFWMAWSRLLIYSLFHTFPNFSFFLDRHSVQNVLWFDFDYEIKYRIWFYQGIWIFIWMVTKLFWCLFSLHSIFYLPLELEFLFSDLEDIGVLYVRLFWWIFFINSIRELGKFVEIVDSFKPFLFLILKIILWSSQILRGNIL